MRQQGSGRVWSIDTLRQREVSFVGEVESRDHALVASTAPQTVEPPTDDSMPWWHLRWRWLVAEVVLTIVVAGMLLAYPR